MPGPDPDPPRLILSPSLLNKRRDSFCPYRNELEDFKLRGFRDNKLVEFCGISWSALDSFRNGMYLHEFGKHTVFSLTEDEPRLGVHDGTKGTRLFSQDKLTNTIMDVYPLTETPVADGGDFVPIKVSSNKLKEYRPQRFSLAEVIAYVIKPKLLAINRQRGKLRNNRFKPLLKYIDLLRDVDETMVGKEFQGTYIVASVQTQFEKLYSTLKGVYIPKLKITYEQNHPEGKKLEDDEIYIFLEAFCGDCGVWKDDPNTNQDDLLKAKEEYVHAAQKAASSFDNRLVIFDSWSQPTLLTRLWCVSELYGIQKYKADFLINFAGTGNIIDFIKTAVNEPPDVLMLFPHFFDEVNPLRETIRQAEEDNQEAERIRRETVKAPASTTVDDATAAVRSSTLSLFAFIGLLDFKTLKSTDFDGENYADLFKEALEMTAKQNSGQVVGFQTAKNLIKEALLSKLSEDALEIVNMEGPRYLEKGLLDVLFFFRSAFYFFKQAGELRVADTLIHRAKSIAKRSDDLKKMQATFAADSMALLSHPDYEKKTSTDLQRELKVMEKYICDLAAATMLDHMKKDLQEKLNMMHQNVITFLQEAERLARNPFLQKTESLARNTFLQKTESLARANVDDDDDQRLTARFSKFERKLLKLFENNILMHDDGIFHGAVVDREQAYNEAKNAVLNIGRNFRNKEFEETRLLADFRLAMAHYYIQNDSIADNLKTGSMELRKSIELFESKPNNAFQAVCRRIEIGKILAGKGYIGMAQTEFDVAQARFAQDQEKFTEAQASSIQAELDICFAYVLMQCEYYEEAIEHLTEAEKQGEKFVYGKSNFTTYVQDLLYKCEKGMNGSENEIMKTSLVQGYEEMYGPTCTQIKDLDTENFSLYVYPGAVKIM